MNICLQSDLHTEFQADKGRSYADSLDPTDVDVLVLAGDIVLLERQQDAINFFSRVCEKYKDVVYVLGNHENYFLHAPDAHIFYGNLTKRFPNLHVLDDSTVTLGSHRFVGSTLWFSDDPLNAVFQRNMADFQVIKSFNPWVYQKNTASLKFLNSTLEKGDILVTHHLPAPWCINHRYRLSELNRFFLCDISDLIKEREIALSLFGHTHCSVDTIVDGTRYLSNPRGYEPHDLNPDFIDKLIIEI